MKHYYLAVDIGASSGRHMLASLENGKLCMEEIYRFENGMEEKDGVLCWDVNKLYQQVLNGLKQCKKLGKIPAFMGIDTWAIDYVLLDEKDRIIGNTVGYRDNRTAFMDAKVYNIIPEKELYERTGIQKQIFNTIFQLMALKEKEPEQMEAAASLLMIPDYLHFRLTGVKKSEYTNATTTQLVHAKEKKWDHELIQKLGFNEKMFGELSMPGSRVGRFLKETIDRTGFDCTVVLPATHDTGSAVLAVPSNEENAVYISSGTWSLMGVERKEADCSERSRKLNFTNEGGYDYRFRYLKNIMGLWMIQSVKKEWEQQLSFAEICDMASKETISSIVDCNDQSFLAPASMSLAVQQYCQKTKQQIPHTVGEIAAVIYNSLARCYGDTVTEIESITGISCNKIHIIGGGANADYLNQLTARYTKRTVLAGPTEATAIGNIMVQMLYAGELKSLAQARACIKNSIEIKEYSF